MNEVNDKLRAAEYKLGQANALFGDMLDRYFKEKFFNTTNPDENERMLTLAFLQGYPHWSKLLQLLFETTTEGERILKELHTYL